MFVWKHMFHVFFVSFVIIVLTTCTGLRAVDSLSGCSTVEVIIAFEGSVFGNKSTPVLEVIFRFQFPQDQMILALLGMY
jgi:hypothetical protein